MLLYKTKNNKITFDNTIKRKYSGFSLSIGYLSNNFTSCGVICGIFKRPFWHIDKKNINFGYLYIRLDNLIKLIK